MVDRMHREMRRLKAGFAGADDRDPLGADFA
jgi:hypothetical protein